MVRMFRRSNGKLYLEYEAYGKTVQKSTRLLDTKPNRALVKKEVIPALQGKILRGELLQEKPKTFSYYSEIYLSDKKHLKTYKKVKKYVEVINEVLGDIRIDQLKKSDIKDWAREMLLGRTSKTVRNYLTSIRGVIDIAIDREVIKNNLAHNLKLPSHKPKEVEPFSPSEVRKLLEHANGFYRLYLAIGFYTGLRTGEILGLMHGDIDLERRVISIKRSISDGELTTPKTFKSIREVPILDDLVPYLKKSKKSFSWLFPKEDGSYLKGTHGNHYREWCKLLEECNISYRKLYATRHTFIVSMLKYSDLSILEIAQMAGHTTTQMIIQNYGKYIKGEHLKIDKSLKLFTDKSTDSIA